MSAEVLESLYLRCDHNKSDPRRSRCTVRFGFGGRVPVLIESLEGLARNAEKKGWRVEIHDEGLNGWFADAFCPDHAGEAK